MAAGGVSPSLSPSKGDDINPSSVNLKPSQTTSSSAALWGEEASTFNQNQLTTFVGSQQIFLGSSKIDYTQPNYHPKPQVHNQANQSQRSYLQVVQGPNHSTGPSSSQRQESNLDLESLVLKPISMYQGIPAVVFPLSERNSLVGKLNFVLVGKFSHGMPTLKVIRLFFSALKLQKSCTITKFDKKHIFLECYFKADYYYIWLHLNWHIEGFNMRVHKWSADFNTYKESTTVPVWIRLEGLPLYMFDERSLLTIANSIGKPIKVDPRNVDRTVVHSARICVELDVSKSMLDSVWVSFEDDVTKVVMEGFLVKIRYDEVPLYCGFCSHIGHGFSTCKRREESRVQETFAVQEIPNLRASEIIQTARSLGPETVLDSDDRKSCGLQEDGYVKGRTDQKQNTARHILNQSAMQGAENRRQILDVECSTAPTQGSAAHHLLGDADFCNKPVPAGLIQAVAGLLLDSEQSPTDYGTPVVHPSHEEHDILVLKHNPNAEQSPADQGAVWGFGNRVGMDCETSTHRLQQAKERENLLAINRREDGSYLGVVVATKVKGSAKSWADLAEEEQTEQKPRDLEIQEGVKEVHAAAQIGDHFKGYNECTKTDMASVSSMKGCQQVLGMLANQTTRGSHGVLDNIAARSAFEELHENSLQEGEQKTEHNLVQNPCEQTTFFAAEVIQNCRDEMDCLDGALGRDSGVETAAGHILQQLFAPAGDSTDWAMAQTMNKVAVLKGADATVPRCPGTDARATQQSIVLQEPCKSIHQRSISQQVEGSPESDTTGYGVENAKPKKDGNAYGEQEEGVSSDQQTAADSNAILEWDAAQVRAFVHNQIEEIKQEIGQTEPKLKDAAKEEKKEQLIRDAAKQAKKAKKERERKNLKEYFMASAEKINSDLERKRSEQKGKTTGNSFKYGEG